MFRIARLRFAHLAAAGRCFLLATDARLLIVLTASGLGKNAVLLNLAVKLLQRRLEAIGVGNPNFGHMVPPSPGQDWGKKR